MPHFTKKISFVELFFGRMHSLKVCVAYLREKKKRFSLTEDGGTEIRCLVEKNFMTEWRRKRLKKQMDTRTNKQVETFWGTLGK